MNFEEKLDKLESLSEKISNSSVDLQSALDSFEEGMKITRELEAELEKIEGKIEILVEGKEGTDGKKEEEAADRKKRSKDAKGESFSLELFKGFNEEETKADDVVGTRK